MPTSLGSRSLASHFSLDEKILEPYLGSLLLFSKTFLSELRKARDHINLHITLISWSLC